EQARAWDRVLCLNGCQIAFGPPRPTLTLDVLAATYGGAIVTLPGEGGTATPRTRTTTARTTRRTPTTTDARDGPAHAGGALVGGDHAARAAGGRRAR